MKLIIKSFKEYFVHSKPSTSVLKLTDTSQDDSKQETASSD